MKKISIVLMVIFLVGCTSMHSTGVIDEYATNIEEAKENVVKLATLSEFKTCFIRACLGSHINQIPYEMVIALDEIDNLLAEIGDDYSLMNDCQKGQILGLWSRLVVLGILEIIEDINPGLLVGLL